MWWWGFAIGFVLGVVACCIASIAHECNPIEEDE